MRNNQDVAFEELHRRVTVDAHPARPVGDNVVGNHVLGTRQYDLGK
jgi:hypothetical protein